MIQSCAFIFKVFLVLSFLNFNIAWGMEEGESDSNLTSHGISYRLTSQGQALSQEELKVYTHSHLNFLNSHMKALYIGRETKLVLEDQEQGKILEQPLLSADDDAYMRLVKEAFVKYPGNDSPNHLFVKIETAYYHPKRQSYDWRSFFLGFNGVIRDFCSAPPIFRLPLNLSINKDKSERVIVTPGTQLKREGEKLKPVFAPHQFHLLSYIDHQFIPLTNKGYPHSEMDALNTLLTNQIIDHMITPTEEGESLRGIIIKFYSYNDICPDCQLAINLFMPKFQAIINEKYRERRNIPILPIGIVNHCYGFNTYYHKEDECKESPLYSNLKNTEKGLQFFLNEGVAWESLPQSRYNPRVFPLHYFGRYQPFNGAIHVPSNQQEPPPLSIYIKQPDLSDLREHIKPELMERFKWNPT